jgi:pyruvate dehydrogenase E2 component (dihydrolipoamide acetyltransferase)
VSATGEAIAVEVPDIGDFAEVPVIEIHVAPGDTVAAEDPLLTLESDKATMDVPAPFAGEVAAIEVAVGDRVSQGMRLLTIMPGADGVSAAPDEEAPRDDPPAPPPSSEKQGGSIDQTPTEPVYASPAVRRIARERGLDLHGLTGSGRGGRISLEDLEGGAPPPAGGSASAIQGLELAPWPNVNYERYGPVERVPRSRIQRISAPALARNWVMIPHVTHNDEADVTDLEAWRRELNTEVEVKVTMVAFLILASVRALHEFPDFNASLDGDELVRKRYWNIGFAADTPQGLVVPVIRDADQKGLVEIAAELGELSGRARAGKLGPGDMQGATFTISSLGGIGGTSFTPIVNAPEVAILGATRSAMKPVWDGEQFRPRLMLPLSLSYDHRVIDGAAAARFTAYLARVLSDLRRVLL